MVPIKKRKVRGIAESDTDAFYEHVGETELYSRVVDLLHLIAKDEIIQYLDKRNGLTRIKNVIEELLDVLQEEQHGEGTSHYSFDADAIGMRVE
jgi:hypothetical protein